MGCLSKLGQYPSSGPPTYQIIKVPNANHMNVMKTSLTIILNVSSGAPSLLLEIVQVYPLLHKGLGHLAALYLLVARYYLSYHKTIYYLLFQCLQRKPYRKRLIISFCFSLGSTLLLIERTMIDPLHLWVIKSLFWRCCQGV